MIVLILYLIGSLISAALFGVMIHRIGVMNFSDLLILVVLTILSYIGIILFLAMFDSDEDSELWRKKGGQ